MGRGQMASILIAVGIFGEVFLLYISNMCSMLSGNEKKIVIELLSVFPLEERIKLTFTVSRKVALFMVKTMELGAQSKADQSGLFSIANDGTLEELTKIEEEILEKAGLTNLNQKLKALQNE